MENIKKALLLILIWVMPVALSAQSEEAITEVINLLFKGMHDADTALVRSVFTGSVTMFTPTKTKDGKPVLKRATVNEFVQSIGKPHAEPLSEEIWNTKIQVDGDFAQVWCDYAFYIGNTFNHCGVDAFHLCKTESGWKIFHLADTRRKEGCIIPDEIQKKHR